MILGMMAAVALMGAGDPDGIVVTAPEGRGAPLVAAPLAVDPQVVEATPRQSAAHGLSTDEQIEQWIAARREADPGLPFEQAIEDDGEIHGEFSVGIGTGGYRQYGGAVSVPVGSGRIDVHFSQVENDFRRRYDRDYRDGEYYGLGEADRLDPWGHTPTARRERPIEPELRSPR